MIMNKEVSIEYNRDIYIIKSKYDYDLYEAKLNKNKEIERLNNIINELEKYLKEREQHFLIDNCQKEIIYEYRRISTEYTKALDKLKELKGGI